MSLVWHSSFCKESISQLLYWFWKVLSWQLELKMNFIGRYRKEQGPSSHVTLLYMRRKCHCHYPSLLSSFTPHWHQMKSLKALTCTAYFLWKFACPQRVCVVFFFLFCQCYWDSPSHPQWSEEASAEQIWIGKLILDVGSEPTDVTILSGIIAALGLFLAFPVLFPDGFELG